MKHLLLTTIAAVLLVATTAFADPIHDATQGGNLAGVQAELDKGVDVNAKGERDMTPLHEAWRKDIVELLIAKGADVNAKDDGGWTPLHRAAQHGRKEVAELLIAAGADVNVKNEDGFTPLHSAATKEIAELLIAEGADVNATDNNSCLTCWGRTPLHWANNKEIAELLIDAGADVNAEDGDGDTSLDWAIMRNHTEIADLLHKHGGKTKKELEAEGK